MSNMKETEVMLNDWSHVLVLPHSLMYLGSKTLLNLRSVCKLFHIKEYQASFWTALSHSVAIEKGLFIPPRMISSDPKQFFFEV